MTKRNQQENCTNNTCRGNLQGGEGMLEVGIPWNIHSSPQDMR